MSITYLPIIEQMKTLSTEKEIQFLLSTVKDDTTWLNILTSALDPKINYWIKTINDEHWEEIRNSLGTFIPTSVEYALDKIKALSNREITGDAAYIYLMDILAYSSEPELIKLIIKRDFKMGVGVKTLNKAYGSSFIKETPYMRCSLLSEKTLKNISYPCYSQLKCDGQYIAMTITADGIETVSRQGKDYDFLKHFEKDAIALRNSYGYDITLTGEMLVIDDSGVSNRETGNGIVQKFGKGTGTLEEVKDLKFIVWDVIPYSSYLDSKDDELYEKRFNTLLNNLEITKSETILPIEYKICNTQQEVYDHYFECIERGEEGSVIKDFKLEWKSGTSTKQLKVKLSFDCDLRIIGFKNGKLDTWNEKILGAVICQSEDGILEVSVGQWTEELRYKIWENQEDYLGTVIEVTAHRLTKDKKTERPSLYLPRFKSFRKGDKDTCDTYERIQEIAESVTLIKKMTHEQD